MEVLTLILLKKVENSNVFRFHSKCEKIFTDDLIMFSYGDVNSASILMDSLEMFTHVSCLAPSLTKSKAFFANVDFDVKQTILNIMSFEEGYLPVRYLGVPLISTRHHIRDCKVLVE